MAGDLAAVRTGIVALLQGLDIGLVHDRERYAKNDSGMKQLYVREGTLRGWFVRRIRTREESQELGRWVAVHQWRIRGFRALDDDANSEHAFDNDIESIRDAMRNDDTLGGLVDSCIIGNQAGILVEDSGPVLFAGVLCHSATLALQTRVYL